MLWMGAAVLAVAAWLAGRWTRSWWFVTGPLLVPFAVLIIGSDYLPDMADCTRYADLLATSNRSGYPSVLWAVCATAGRLWRLRATRTGPSGTGPPTATASNG